MERFRLNTWLEDKSRKIVTRDGKQARIICYDVKKGKQDDYNVPIIALVDRGEEFGEMSYYYTEDGRFLRNPDHTHNLDLFFADEEEELTELQKTLEEDCDYYVKLYNDGNTREELREWIKCWCHRIIELARKEIEKENPYSGNQKQEWGEEDEKLYTSALWHIKNSCGNGGNDSGEYEVYNWLKSLKDRVQPKQEWSEEDKSMYIRTLGILGKCYMGELPTKVEEELKWFKSITDKAQPQTNQYDKGYEDGYSAAKYNQWKPKKEELEALRKRTYFCEGIDANLDSLYTNLLKL